MAVKNEEIVILDSHKVAHHEIASLHREMNDAEFESLKLDIELNGQIFPIITYKGKLVDGRHRQRALIELGIHDIKAMALPGNLSLVEVKERVMGTEMRRTDNVAQKAIRGYRWYLDNADTATQQAAATKFGVGVSEISRAKKLNNMAGSDMLDKLYNRGYLILGGKRYTTLVSIIKMINTEEEDQKDREPMSDEAEAVKDILYSMLLKGDIPGIAYAEGVAKRLRMKDA